jgi:hypothetical protein
MRALLENFCVYHVNAPGQEEGAPTLPDEWVVNALLKLWLRLNTMIFVDDKIIISNSEGDLQRRLCFIWMDRKCCMKMLSQKTQMGMQPTETESLLCIAQFFLEGASICFYRYLGSLGMRIRQGYVSS